MCALSTLQFYHDRVHRLVEEALEVALVLCNTELREFSVAKVFDIFNQILPTAFIIGTSYWPYYYTLQKQKLCACARYGIMCRHFRTRKQNHFIDMDPIMPDESLMFCVKKGVSVVPSQYFIDVIPLTTEGTSGYSISMKFTLKYQRNSARGMKRVKKDEQFIIPESTFPISIFCRYNFQREYYSDIHTIRFEPNPLFYDTYGSMFHRLVSIRPYVLSLISQPTPDFSAQRYMQVHAQEMPDFTLILQHVVNMPLFVNYSKIVAVPAKISQCAYRRPAVHRGTQTSSEEQLISESYGQYRQRTSHLRALWRYTTRDSILNSTISENAVLKIQEITDDDDLQETTVTTTANVNVAVNIDDSTAYNDDDDKRSIDSDALIIEENANEIPDPFSSLQSSPEYQITPNVNQEERKNNKVKYQSKIINSTKNSEQYLAYPKESDDETFLKSKNNTDFQDTPDQSTNQSNSKKDPLKGSCRFKVSRNQCHATSSINMVQNNCQQNWTYQKIDNSQSERENQLFPTDSKNNRQANLNDQWPDYGFQKVSYKRHQRKTSLIFPNQQAFHDTADNISSSAKAVKNGFTSSLTYGNDSWPTFACGTSYASNRIYGISYAQVTKPNRTAAITSESLQNGWSDLKQDFFLNENHVINSPDSTSHGEHDSKPLVTIEGKKEMENGECAKIIDWISPKTPSDFVLLTDNDIDQHFQDMEEIIRDDTVLGIKKEIIE